MGPVGFEPTTKGFTSPRRFRREWTISSPVRTARVGAGCSSLSSRALKPSGSLCTFRRCTGGSAQGCHGIAVPKGSLNSSRPLRAFPREGTVSDESPALTAVLQAQPRRIVAARRLRSATTGGGERDRVRARRLHPVFPGTRRSR